MVDAIDTIGLTVFGGSPTTIDVSVDYGQQGDRGSNIYAGPGDPATYAPSTKQLYDWYINYGTADQYYGWMYQYTLVSTSPSWVPVIKLNNYQYSVINTTTFTSGVGIITIPASNLTSNTALTLADFTVRYNIKNSTPVSSGFTYALTGSGITQNIVITINGISYDGSSWSNLTGSKDVHLFISYKK